MTFPDTYQIAIGEGFPLRAGDDWDVPIPLENDAGVPLAWPAGATARMHIRARASDAAPLLALTSAAGQLALEPGALRIVVEDSLTGIAAGAHVFDVEVTVGGLRQTFIGGTIHVGAKITRGA